jgi:two-component system, chemotaxis family, chemotaxis protein CheY
MKVLIVDDSTTMRNFLSAIVQDLAIDTEQAASGEEALQRLGESGPFDLAMVDWNMPGMDGLDLVRRIRREPEWSSTKLMMVTARTDRDAVIEAMSWGADDFLMKPLTPAMVADKFKILGILD